MKLTKLRLAGPNDPIYKSGLQVYTPASRPATKTMPTATCNAIPHEAATSNFQEDANVTLPEGSPVPTDQTLTTETDGDDRPKKERPR